MTDPVYKTGGMFEKVCPYCHRPKLTKYVEYPPEPGKLNKVEIVWSLCVVCDALKERGLIVDA